MVHYARWWERRKFGGVEAKEWRTALTAANVSGYVETWKRVWKSAWRLERAWGQGWGRVWIEGTPWSREIHQTRPRAPFAGATYGGAARTASTELRRPRRYRGDGRGLRAKNKISSTVCPLWERNIFLHPLSVFLLLRISKASLYGSLTYSPSATFLTRVCRWVHACHSYSQIRRLDTFAFAGICHRVFKESLMECIDTLEMQNRRERSEIRTTSH